MKYFVNFVFETNTSDIDSSEMGLMVPKKKTI